jgi:adenylate cyclase
MTEVIFEHGGMLGKYLGDGLMAVFGLPHQPPEPETRAVHTGLKMLDQIEQINLETGEQVNIGVGINTGTAMAGYLGSEEYVEFTVIGYPINIAWGLESLARPNRVFIGYPTYQAVSGKFSINPLGSIGLKQHTEPIPAFEVLRDRT